MKRVTQYRDLTPEQAERYHELVYDEAAWSMKDIAGHLGVTYQTVRVWRCDGVLPPEDLNVDGKPIWHAGTIRRWAIDTERMTRDGKPMRKKPPGRPPRGR